MKLKLASKKHGEKVIEVDNAFTIEVQNNEYIIKDIHAFSHHYLINDISNIDVISWLEMSDIELEGYYVCLVKQNYFTFRKHDPLVVGEVYQVVDWSETFVKLRSILGHLNSNKIISLHMKQFQMTFQKVTY